MKLNKTLLLLLLVSFTFSCSEDTTEDSIVSPEGQFDNSRLGEYKGVFTTNDGLTRGSMDLNLSTSEGTAKITLSTGEVVELKSASVGTTVSNLRFSSMGLSSIDASFDFSVEDNGMNPMVTNVSFDNKESDILIAKNLSRAPATTLTGTYDCTNCAEVGVGFPNGRTWNVMITGAGGNNQTYTAQVAYDDYVYTTTATQNGCAINNFNPAYTTCNIAGSVNILGFNLTYGGQHSYPNSPDESCSFVTGSWSAPGYGPGVNGTFTSAGTENSCF